MPRLDEIADIFGGFSFKSSDLADAGIPVVKIADIRPPLVSVASCQRVSPSKTLGLSKYVLQDGDIVMAMTGATTGKVGRYRATEPAYLNQRVAKIMAKQGRDFDDYVYAIVSEPGFDKKVLNNASGSAQPNVSAEGIGRIEVPALPRSDQLAVGRIVAAIDDKIELNRKMSATLEVMAKTLFKSWFVNFEPVRAKAEGRVTGLAPRIAALFPHSFAKLSVTLCPSGWSLRGLDEVASFLNGLALQQFPPIDDAPTLPVIKIAQLRAGHSMGADRAAATLKPDYVVANGDILFSWSGSLECHIWTGGPAALNQHLFRVRGTEVPDFFAYLAVLEHLPEFREIAAGKATTMGHIQRHHLHNATIAVPPDPLLQATTSIIQPIVEASWKRRLESATLVALRDALLPNLISGALRVNGAL